MPQAEKVVRYIAPKASVSEDVKNKYKQKRVAAYCRVSTQQEEQINSYEVQTRYYTEKINSEPKWKLVQIFADKGISGTSTKHRDEFNKMIRMCKRGRIDMIITKSISRFARNTVDCLKYIRMLKDINVDVFFEEQGIHSIENGSEFYITVYGSIAQSESENISANVKWGKEQSAREGNVSFHYKNFLGYRKGDDGKPEIVPEEAETIQYIYERFLAGDSHQTIISKLESNNILTPGGKEKWTYGTLHSILTNERYIKSIINQIISAQKLNKARRDMGLDTVCSSKHMIITGNPGSAKTTVARLLASILYDEHVLNKNKFIECGRQDLVGKYVGWTAKQVEVQFQKAKGGSCLLTKRILLLKKKAYTVTRRSTRSFR